APGDHRQETYWVTDHRSEIREDEFLRWKVGSSVHRDNEFRIRTNHRQSSGPDLRNSKRDLGCNQGEAHDGTEVRGKGFQTTDFRRRSPLQGLQDQYRGCPQI